jgi:hypothetical protein
MVKKRNIKVWYGKLKDAPRFPDVAYWQGRPDEEKFAAAWQMVLEAYAIKGEELGESRLQRSVAGFQRLES